MQLNYLLTFWFLTSVNSYVVDSATMCKGIAYPVSAFQDKLLHGYFIKAFNNVPMVTQCAALCVRNVYCASFFHNKVDGRCHLHYKVLQNPANADVCSGCRYYVLSAEGKSYFHAHHHQQCNVENSKVKEGKKWFINCTLTTTPIIRKLVTSWATPSE